MAETIFHPDGGSSTMRHFGTLFLLASLLLTSSACDRAGAPASVEKQQVGELSSVNSTTTRAEPEQMQMQRARADETKTATGVAEQAATSVDSYARKAQYETQKISFDPNGQQSPITVVPDRKVIRNAELTLELDAPVEAQRSLASIAESHGGFVVTSESRQDERARGSQGSQIVSVEMRVPSAQFDSVLSAVRGVGGRVRQEKITGRDVTEEFIDLEARLRAQRALETQILEIMKRAQRVSDALEVNAQLAQVRSEIERLEGRRRFLENQSSLSTIKITLQPPAPLVSARTTGFFAGVRRAFGEGVDFAASIVLAVVRVTVALLPVAVLLLLPAALAWRFARRRLQRRPKAVEEWRASAPPAGA
jgi:murein DD-endopeptidase MepM/ murein hydrolase activator NlpD